MKVTRFFQSCILIEENGSRILIDPSAQEKDRNFGKLDAVLYTHEHADHFDAEMAKNYAEQDTVAVYANASTAKLIKTSKKEVKDGDEFEVANLKIKAIELPHCLMVDGSQGPQNTGYLVNDKLFHPGDGKELNGLNVDTLAVPISGPDISLHDAFLFTKQVGAKQVIPIHYDYVGGNPDFFDSTVSKAGVKTHGLKIGESVQL